MYLTGLARPGPTMTLFNSLFLYCVQRYELDSSTQDINWLQIDVKKIFSEIFRTVLE